MLRFERHPGGTRAVAVLIAFLLAPVYAAEEDGALVDGPSIPPGQEELLLKMLGKGTALPDGCRLTDGRVEYTVVEATYKCRAGEVVLELAHPSEAFRDDVQTEQFTFAVIDGSAPESLTDAVGALIRSGENDFEWTWPATESAGEPEEGGVYGEQEDGTLPGDPRW